MNHTFSKTIYHGALIASLAGASFPHMGCSLPNSRMLERQTRTLTDVVRHKNSMLAVGVEVLSGGNPNRLLDLTERLDSAPPNEKTAAEDAIRVIGILHTLSSISAKSDVEDLKSLRVIGLSERERSVGEFNREFASVRITLGELLNGFTLAVSENNPEGVPLRWEAVTAEQRAQLQDAAKALVAAIPEEPQLFLDSIGAPVGIDEKLAQSSGLDFSSAISKYRIALRILFPGAR